MAQSGKPAVAARHPKVPIVAAGGLVGLAVVILAGEMIFAGGIGRSGPTTSPSSRIAQVSLAPTAGDSARPSLLAPTSPTESPVLTPSLSPASPQSGTFGPAGSMISARAGHTATLLADGRVLLAGGTDGNQVLASAELYDPKTGTFSATGSMTTPRIRHTATLLSDGRVLIAGGADGNGNEINSSAELYDPSTGTFRATGSMLVGRERYTATLLTDGRVLFAGGDLADASTYLSSAELYDQSTGTFVPTGSMETAREGQTATLLADGRVLMAGGQSQHGYLGDLSTAELYDARTGAFSPTGSMTTSRSSQTATLLADGRVLIAGGERAQPGGAEDLSSAELYDPKTAEFTAAGSMPESISGYPGYRPTLLTDGRVLFAGGYLGGSYTASALLYDPNSSRFAPTGPMSSGRYGHTITLLAEGRVLVAGGWVSPIGGVSPYASAELYQP